MKIMLKILTVGLLLVVACAPKGGSKDSIFIEKDFTLSSIDDETITLSDNKGKVILVDFWATWCPPCRAAIPSVVQLYNKYHDQGFIVLGISNEDKYLLRKFRDEKGIPYPILLGTNEVIKTYGVQGIPHMLIIDKKGIIRKTQVGFYEELEPQFDALIDSLLKE